MMLAKLRNWRNTASAEFAVTALGRPEPTEAGSDDCRTRLHSPAELAALLDRERNRTDRSGQPFAFVLLRVPADANRTQNIDRLARHVSQRLRAVDAAGRLDADRLGVILTGTGAEGARAFIRNLKTLDGVHVDQQYEVFVYPAEKTEGPHSGNGSGGSSRNGHDRPEPAELPTRAASGPVLTVEARVAATVEHMQALCDAHVDDLDEVPAPRPAEPLFAQPLPVWKRLLDVVGVCVGLVLVAPVLLIAAVLVKATSRGPIIFKQTRIGLGGRPFTIYKFRTMCVDAEARKAELRRFSEQDGPAFKIKNDPRLTRVGGLLRKTCIDELPQLWNVLKGDMTLVGPRPIVPDEAEQIAVWQRRRFDVTPGLTCIWQVYGKSRVPHVEWMRMDIRYLRVRSFLGDLKLVARTAVMVLLHRGSG